MDLQEKKERVKKLIDEINDDSSIHNIWWMIEYTNFQKKEPLIKRAITEDELIQRALISEEDIKNARTISIEELRGNAKKW